MISHEEANDIAAEFYAIRLQAEKSKSAKVKAKYNNQLNNIMNKLSYLVTSKANKYRKFHNHLDLQQEGYEAMIMGLKTYNPQNNNVIWWLNKYIATRISRAASNHSVIRIPINKTKEFTPYKEKKLPDILDFEDPNMIYEDNENKKILYLAVNKLPSDQREVINLLYDLKSKGLDSISITEICKKFNITRHKGLKLIKQATDNLKNNINELND